MYLYHQLDIHVHPWVEPRERHAQCVFFFFVGAGGQVAEFLYLTNYCHGLSNTLIFCLLSLGLELCYDLKLMGYGESNMDSAPREWFQFKGCFQCIQTSVKLY